MVHANFSLVFNISLELCLLGLPKFTLETLLFWTLFGDFIPNGENFGAKAS
jgi:hypothetical protein